MSNLNLSFTKVKLTISYSPTVLFKSNADEINRIAAISKKFGENSANFFSGEFLVMF